MASVRKREWVYKGEQKSAWIVSYTDLGGNRRQETFERKREADAARARIEIELQGGYHTAKGESVDLNTAIDEWLKDCHRRHLAGDRMTKTTLYNYEHHAKPVRAALGAVLLTDLSFEIMQKYIDEQSPTLAKRTVISRLHILKRAVKFSVKRKWLRRSPFDDEQVRHAKPGFDEKRIPSKEEIFKLLNGLQKRSSRADGDTGNQRFRLHNHRAGMVFLALFAGLRRGEILGLQWENVDLVGRIIHVKHSQSRYDGLKSPKTRAGYRQVPMSTMVLQALLVCGEMDGNPTKGYVFSTPAGKPYDGPNVSSHTWSTLMKQSDLMDENGKPLFSFHALRHANVSLLIEEGLPPMHVARLIGHADANITLSTYAHLFPEDQRSIDAAHALAEKFAQIEFKAEKPEDPTEYRRRYLAEHRDQLNEKRRERRLLLKQQENDMASEDIEITQ